MHASIVAWLDALPGPCPPHLPNSNLNQNLNLEGWKGSDTITECNTKPRPSKRKRASIPFPSPSLSSPNAETKIDVDISTKGEGKGKGKDMDTPTRPKRPRLAATSNQEKEGEDEQQQQQQQQGQGQDVDATPRGTGSAPIPTAESQSISSASASVATSSRSRKSASPRKRLRSLAVRDDGIKTMPFPTTAAGAAAAAAAAAAATTFFPSELGDMVQRMVHISHGIGIISPSHTVEVDAAVRSSGVFIPPFAIATAQASPLTASSPSASRGAGYIPTPASASASASTSTFRAHTSLPANTSSSTSTDPSRPDAGAEPWHWPRNLQDRDAFGPTPVLADVFDVVNWALEFQREGAEEAAWNSSIHARLLSLALHGPGGRFCQNLLVGFTQCTTAGIIKEYLTTGEPGKKVDFCLHVDPAHDSNSSSSLAPAPTTVARVDALRAGLPLQSINHTDHEALSRRPIAVSIETKRRDADRPAEAHLQIGIWHAAQWRMLETLLVVDIDNQHEQQHQQRPKRYPESKLPPFLPAVIINGHDWSFVATTRDGRKTNLWAEIPFGSTRDVVGVYKIIFGLQALSTWVKDCYWPWYRVYVLGSA